MTTPTNNTHNRLMLLQTWLNKTLKESIELAPIVGDASFRRYFRFQYKSAPFVAMDSPPNKEDCKPFVAITRAFYEAGLSTPKIHAADCDQGFLVLDDFGDQLYHHCLNNDNVDTLYQTAIGDLPKIQRCSTIQNYTLPVFSERLLHEELQNFTHWFLTHYLKLPLNNTRKKLLEKSFTLLIDNATNQPQVTVHRDYHSRNLMILPHNRVGILDFQDALVGPITYDLVSLIRDCYIDWPLEKVNRWALNFRQQLIDDKRIDHVAEETFLRWMDLMGVQRHLKAIFIFARKQLRDDSDFYLQFIPRTLNYVKQIASGYRELNDFNSFLNEEVLPIYSEM